MIEGSGVGSVPLTKGSGSQRPKNIRIRIPEAPKISGSITRVTIYSRYSFRMPVVVENTEGMVPVIGSPRPVAHSAPPQDAVRRRSTFTAASKQNKSFDAVVEREKPSQPKCAKYFKHVPKIASEMTEEDEKKTGKKKHKRHQQQQQQQQQEQLRPKQQEQLEDDDTAAVSELAAATVTKLAAAAFKFRHTSC
jgi:hypothetical protein